MYVQALFATHYSGFHYQQSNKAPRALCTILDEDTQDAEQWPNHHWPKLHHSPIRLSPNIKKYMIMPVTQDLTIINIHDTLQLLSNLPTDESLNFVLELRGGRANAGPRCHKL